MCDLEEDFAFEGRYSDSGTTFDTNRMDNGSLTSEHEADSGLGSMNSFEGSVYVAITVPELNIQKTVQFSPEETVWFAKQHVLQFVAKGLKDGFNYGLFVPPTNGKAGKFLDEGRLLKEYPLSAPFGKLELISKRRIYKHVMATEKRMKQLHTKSSLKMVMDWVRKGDVEKVIKVTNRGLDPNFIDHDSGETPLTMSATLEHPSKMILSLVGGGAHLDYRNAKSLTAMHVAAINGKDEAIKSLLDLGASANYYDLHGLTPAYHCVCNNSSPRCLEMLLYDHATLGATDDSNWTELHQAAKHGRVQHLELMIYYGANLNAQNSGGNTPLHICAVNNQEDCARVVLFRGADKTIKNFANHDAVETAIISGNTVLAQIIRNFSDDDVVPYQEVPTLNEKRRTSLLQSNMGTLQRWRSNPQIHFLAGDDQLSVKSSPGKRQYDLTLPQNAGALNGNGFPRRASSVVAPAAGGLKLHGPQFNANDHVASQRGGQQTAKHSTPLARTVFLKPGRGGYGFILRGSRGSAENSNFVPTLEVPGLQYFSIIAENSMAEQAGIRPRDFLLEVNGQDVRRASHDYTVNLIKHAKDILCLVVISPVEGSSPDVKTSSLAPQNVSFHPGLPTSSKSGNNFNGGLADLEALEQHIASGRSASASDATPQRLLIASDMQTLGRMAKIMNVGSGHGTASIHTTHGKRMTPAVPMDRTYQDAGGMCRGRMSTPSSETPVGGNMKKSNSFSNLPPQDFLPSTSLKDSPVMTPKPFPVKESHAPFGRMLSVPNSDVNGKRDSDSSDRRQSLELMRQRDEQIAQRFRPPPSRPSHPPPPLPSKPGSGKPIGLQGTENEGRSFSAGSGTSGQEGSTQPPQPPPLRPNSALIQRGVMNQKNRPAMNLALSFHSESAESENSPERSSPPAVSFTPTKTTRLPPPPPPLSPPPPLRTASSLASPSHEISPNPVMQASVYWEVNDLEPPVAENSFLHEIQRKRELLRQNEVDHRLKQQISTNSPSTDNRSFVSELQQRNKHVDDENVNHSNHVMVGTVDDRAGRVKAASFASSNPSEEPFFNELSTAITGRSRQNLPTSKPDALPKTTNTPQSTTGKFPAFHNGTIAVQQNPISAGQWNDTDTEGVEESQTRMVKLKPVEDRRPPPPIRSPAGARLPPPPKPTSPPGNRNPPPPCFRPQLVTGLPPPPPKPVSNAPPPFPKSGITRATWKSLPQTSTDDVDDMPPPPPPPPPPAFGDTSPEEFAIDELPLPPPPPSEF